MKKLTPIILTLLILTSAYYYTHVVKADVYGPSLIGWYTLDNNSISGTSVTDYSGNSNTGTLTNSPTTGVAGRLGQAISLNGINQNVIVSSGLGLTSNANITIAGWAYRANTGDHGAFVKIGSLNDGFGIGISNGGSTGFETSGDLLTVLYEAIRWVPTTQNFGIGWHHFVLVVDSSGKPTIYYDGANIYSDVGMSAVSIGSIGTANTQIGGYTSSVLSNRFYTGNLDDIRIYNRSLSAAEVQQLYYQGFQGHVNAF